MCEAAASGDSCNMWVVEYAGCMKINTSMRSLDLDTRALVVKECIARICEARGVKFVCTKRRKQTRKQVEKMMSEKPVLDHSGTRVTVSITTAFLTLTTQLGHLIARHEMQNISFASGGDVETMDYVAYVAKDTQFGRACFVLDCGPNLATDVINTLGQAFEQRYKEFVARQKIINTHTLKAKASGTKPLPPSQKPLPHHLGQGSSLAADTTDIATGSVSPGDADRDYYNDLPGTYSCLF